jgi:hypothetical protein
VNARERRVRRPADNGGSRGGWRGTVSGVGELSLVDLNLGAAIDAAAAATDLYEGSVTFVHARQTVPIVQGS